MTKTVRGYMRGLEIMQSLSQRRIATALELAEDTELPRPTVYRMLGTLVEAG
ncbi:MAG: helix-turn-helix domain-containing protein [Paracoccaceae bacterium]